MSSFCSLKVTKEMVLAIEVNPSGPLLHCLVPRGAKKPALAVLSRLPFVLLVCFLRNVTEILKAVVKPVSVDVVNVPIRPLPVCQGPSKAMGLEKYSDSIRDSLIAMPRVVPDKLPELASRRVVVKFLAQLRDFVVHSSPIKGIPEVPAKMGMNHLFAPSS